MNKIKEKANAWFIQERINVAFANSFKRENLDNEELWEAHYDECRTMDFILDGLFDELLAEVSNSSNEEAKKAALKYHIVDVEDKNHHQVCEDESDEHSCMFYCERAIYFFDKLIETCLERKPWDEPYDFGFPIEQLEQGLTEG